MRTLIALTISVSMFGVLIASLPVIHQWEKANAYPYGKMCNSIFTGYVDTCR